jgi:hypothetical protein
MKCPECGVDIKGFNKTPAKTAVAIHRIVVHGKLSDGKIYNEFLERRRIK